MGATRRSVVLFVFLAGCHGSPDGVGVALRGGADGIGFDDLRYSTTLRRLLVPAGRTGRVDLIDPDTLAVRSVQGFSVTADASGGHGDGATSVDEGAGLLFVTDRTAGQLHAVDPATAQIVASVGLGAGADYVRFVAATSEVWVTEPGAARIEIFAVSTGSPVGLAPRGAIAVTNGPESLVIDQRHGRAYTHRWQRSTVVLDVSTRAVVGEWPNGCASSRGLGIDEVRQHFFVACSEGTLSVLDAANGGAVLSTIARGSGFDVIGYSPTLHHLYAAGTACGCLVVMSVSRGGALSLLGRFDADSSAHCAAADDRGHAWVCDPAHGAVWRVDDPYPRSE